MCHVVVVIITVIILCVNRYNASQKDYRLEKLEAVRRYLQRVDEDVSNKERDLALFVLLTLSVPFLSFPT
jgi:hypothetical protein